MDQEQAERFLEAAEEDYARRIAGYIEAVQGEEKRAYWTREMRSDVLAAQQVLELARTELYRAKVAYERERAALVQRVQREKQDG